MLGSEHYSKGMFRAIEWKERKYQMYKNISRKMSSTMKYCGMRAASITRNMLIHLMGGEY